MITSLLTMSSDRLSIATDSRWRALRIALLLRFPYGLRRHGTAPGGSAWEAYYPDLRRGHLRVMVDWESLAGFSFHAGNEATAEFLLNFAQKHLPDARGGRRDA